ncbi:MAG: amidophosphoribosyltransferase [Bacteriovoracaceae bacterium]|jgi:amidophosphoribosyltransferase|nr:amidophosphoribosyltransferase [Bacteriovoracaceae bacterium]
MCGVIGILGTPYAARESYLGLLMLQHRGQDSAGVMSYDEQTKTFYSEKNLGHIKEAIAEDSLTHLYGNSAIAHTRYSTIGQIRKDEIQPMLMNYPYGILMAHNGNLINSQEVKDELMKKNKRFIVSKNDLEIMMNLLAEELPKRSEKLNFTDITKAIKVLYEKINGAYSTVTYIADQGLIAFKDPKSIRPLVWGKRKLTTEEKKSSSFNFSYAVASESKSLEFLGYSDIQELKNGEVLFIDTNEKIFQEQISCELPLPCMFEWIYFANADSKIWEHNVYQFRLKLGNYLGETLKKKNLPIDIVVPVPDTSRPSAITLSEVLQRPYREVLIKNRYAQRTFILNSQLEREKAIHLKMNVVKEEVKDKNILLVDDSIVRGTTSKKIIQLLKRSGAKKVYLVSTCPPIIKPCYYGIDFPHEEDLLAANKTPEQMAKTVGADAVFFLPFKKLQQAFSGRKTCDACLTGNYPINIDHAQEMIKTRVTHEKSNLPRFS